jgi:hypothetical protein
MSFAAYVGDVRLKDAITYGIQLTDTRRVDLVRSFLEASGDLIQTTVLLGTGSALSMTATPDNATFVVTHVFPPGGGSPGAVLLRYQTGPLHTYNNVPTTQDPDGTVIASQRPGLWQMIDLHASPGIFGQSPATQYGSLLGTAALVLQGLLVDVMDLSGNLEQTFNPLYAAYTPQPGNFIPLLLAPFQPTDVTVAGIFVGDGSILLPWTASQPSVGATFKLRVYSTASTKTFSLAGHPVDLLTGLWTNVGIPWDSASADLVKRRLGPLLAVFYRFDTETERDTTLYDFAQRAITTPFGFTWRVDPASQTRILFICRDLSLLGGGGLAPVATVGMDDLRDGGTPVFDLDERSIKNRVVVTYQTFRAFDPNTDGGDAPADGLVSVNQPPIQVDYSTTGKLILLGVPATPTPEPDSDFAGIKEFDITLPGFVGQLLPGTVPSISTIVPVDMVGVASGWAIGIFGRVGRGVPITEIALRRGSPAAAAEVGEAIVVTFDHMPNALLGRFPTSQRIREGGGARLLQVVQKTLEPAGPTLRCWDIGPAAPLLTVPTFTLALSSTDPQHVVVATLTNGAVIAAEAQGLHVLVEWATGTSAPSDDGPVLGTIDPDAVPTTIQTPPVDAGSRVWVRMATVGPGSLPSSWSAWADLDLTALNPVTDLLATQGADGTSVILTWTPGEANFPVAVYIDGVLLRTLPPGTTQFIVGPVAGSHTYDVYQVDFPPLNGKSTAATATEAPSGGGTLTAPIDPAAFAGRHDDATGLDVLDGTFGFEVTATAIPSDVLFEVASETSIGSGTPGTYVQVGTQAAVQAGRNRYTGVALNDQLRRYMRARSARAGATDSPYSSPVVSVLPWSAVQLPPAPPRLFAVWGIGTVGVFLQGDPKSVSFKIAASTSGFPSDATVRAATALNATNNQATSGTLESGLTTGQIVYVSAFAYTQLSGGGTESAHAQVTFIYGGGAAPVDATYGTVLPESRLPNSRQLAVTAPLTLADGGPLGALVWGIDLSSDAGGLGGQLLGSVSYREPLLFGVERSLRIPAFPSALTDLEAFTGKTKCGHSYKDLSAAGQAFLRITGTIAGALSGAKLAAQYYTGSAWRYYDGVGGPVLSLASAGLKRGAYVAIEAGALFDHEQRIVPLGGDDATLVTLDELWLEWIVAGQAVLVNPGGGSGGGDCSEVAADALVYADNAAAIAAGWSFINSIVSSSWTAHATDQVHGADASSFKCNLNRVFGAPGGTLRASKTFGTGDGLLPSTAYTVIVWARTSTTAPWDTNAGLMLNGIEVPGAGTLVPAGTPTWTMLKGTATTDGSGNLVVAFYRKVGPDVTENINVWWNDLSILVGSDC